MAEIDKDWLTRAEVARLLSVAPRTVDRWRTEGRIAVIKLPGGEHRFRLPRKLVTALRGGDDDV